MTTVLYLNLKVRTLTVALLAGATGLLPVLPPEHVHEAMGTDGGHHAVAHRHSQFHAGNHTSADEVHYELALDDEHAPILTLTSVFTAPEGTLRLLAPVRALVGVVEPPASTCHSRAREFVEHLIHGPPRAPCALRGPPSFLFL